MTALLEFDGLSAGYGEIRVLKGVSASVAEGSITALIGSNGAGKTTIMRSLAGLLQPNAGRCSFGDIDITWLRPDARVGLGLVLVPEGRLLFPEFTVAETLHIGAYPRHARAGAMERMEALYGLFPRLRERRHARAGSLSGGEQQMLALARGLMSAPRLLMLDEPSLGLSPAATATLFDSILEIRRRGITVFLVEQDVHSTLGIADYAYVLEDGLIIAEGRGRDLLDSSAIRTSYLGL